MILLAPESVSDTVRVRNFLETKNPAAAVRALRAIWKVLELVEQHPGLGKRTRDSAIRQIAVRFGASGYVVRYTMRADGTLLVLRIWHGREARK